MSELEVWFEEAEKDVLLRIRRKLVELLEMNAALEYRVDPDFPAPEVLERPGWKFYRADRGIRELEVVRMEAEPAEIWNVLPDPESIHPSFDTVVIRPLVHALVRYFTDRPGTVRWYGMGLDVENRCYVVFTSLTPLPEDVR